MQFPTFTSPFTARPNRVAESMLWVCAALVPGIVAMWFYFGWGTIINIALAVTTAVACEALVLKLRGRELLPTLSDLSAVVTAVLLAIALPPLLPWWLTVLGVVFAILLVKHAYGGLGYNTFNPAMAAYVFLLISYPVSMTLWLPPSVIHDTPLTFFETLRVIFFGVFPSGMTLDAVTMATPLDVMRTELDLHHTYSEIRDNPLWGGFGGRGWEWVSFWFLVGGAILLYKRVITWHIPVSMLSALFVIGLLFFIADSDTHPSPLFHLLSGATIFGAFFIATDPVTACTTPRGQIIFGASIGIIVYIIRSWGGYPDAIAFAVLLLNMAAPTIDHYTRPRVFGHGRSET
jgi:electron transport complex protein RnfD